MLLGAVNLPQVVDAGGLLGLEPRAHEVGDGDGRQQPDDGHDDHDFHEREAGFPRGFDLHKFCCFKYVCSRGRGRWPTTPLLLEILTRIAPKLSEAGRKAIPNDYGK